MRCSLHARKAQYRSHCRAIHWLWDDEPAADEDYSHGLPKIERGEIVKMHIPSRWIGFVLLLAVLLFSVSCSSPGVQQEEGERPDDQQTGERPGELSWQIAEGVPEDFDPSVPMVTLKEQTLFINLPHLPNYEVLDIHCNGQTLTVKTDLPDVPSEDGLLFWICGFSEPDHLVTVELEGLSSPIEREVRILGASGVPIDMRLSVEEAIKVARDFADADFGHPVTLGLGFVDTAERPRLAYSIDFIDDQVIDRTGSNAVKGWFTVDAVTAEVLDSDMQTVPMDHTRIFTKGAEFLDWTADGHLLLAVDGDLQVHSVEGNLLQQVAAEVPFEDLEFSSLRASLAHFRGPEDECVAVCLETGIVDDRKCPPPPVSPFLVDEKAEGETFDRSLEVTLNVAGFVVQLEYEENWDQGRAEAEILVRDDDGETKVPADILGDFPCLRTWDASEARERVYFATEFFGPRYGMWVTEYALWDLHLPTSSLRRVSWLPTPSFALSPNGHWIAYQWRDRVFLVDLIAGH